MVAKVISGKSIAGILRYNERKVSRGFAELLDESKFGTDAGDLSFSQKSQRFALLTRMNKKVKTNAVHISLNFTSEDILNPDKLRQITKTYMEGVGFGNQPYLVYQHFDASHPHLHIVTTNVQQDGERISLHNIGKEKSEPVRKEIEELFCLIPAQSRKKGEINIMQPIDLQKVDYGEVETKATISSYVREVVRSYQFTSLDALRAALEQFNVTVDGGKPGSRMYDKGGLIYSLIDENGERKGMPIKASDIYSKPTLKNIEQRFTKSAIKRQGYQQRLQNTINRTLSGPLRPITEEAFAQALEKKHIHVRYHKDHTGQTTGITYVDNLARTVFLDEELGDEYGISGVSNRMTAAAASEHRDAHMNKAMVEQALAATNFSESLPKVIAAWVQMGLVFQARTGKDGFTRYWFGYQGIKAGNMTEADPALSAWLRANRIGDHHTDKLERRLAERFPARPAFYSRRGPNLLLDGLTFITKEIIGIIQAIVEEVFRLTPGHSHIPYQLFQSSRKKKSTKRRGQRPG